MTEELGEATIDWLERHQHDTVDAGPVGCALLFIAIGFVIGFIVGLWVG